MAWHCIAKKDKTTDGNRPQRAGVGSLLLSGCEKQHCISVPNSPSESYFGKLKLTIVGIFTPLQVGTLLQIRAFFLFLKSWLWNICQVTPGSRLNSDKYKDIHGNNGSIRRTFSFRLLCLVYIQLLTTCIIIPHFLSASARVLAKTKK